MRYERDELLALMKRDALKFGDFTLASGAKSRFYIDARQVALSARGAALIGAGVLAILDEIPCDAVGGLTLGADPVLAAALALAGAAGRPLRGFIVRKEAKQHGTGQRVEGPLRAGDRVCIVEDVTTTGGSAAEAIIAAKAAGATIACVVTVLDRGAGAAALFAAEGIPFRPLLTLADLSLPPS